MSFARKAFAPPQIGAYAGAQYTRLTDDWVASILSADREIKQSLRTLRARSRQLIRDNPNCAGFIAALKTDVIGWEHCGIGIQPRNRDGSGQFNDALNEALESAFEAWGQPEQCSADGVDGWGDLQRHCLGLLAMDGEFLLRKLPGYDNDFGYALQLLDADQLDETFTQGPSATSNEVRMGVEITPYGKPVAYHLWQNHPTEQFKPRVRVRIPADQIIHGFVRLRAGQTRGVPWFTPALIAMHMLDGYTESEVVQSRLAAAAGGFFETLGADNIEAAPLLAGNDANATTPDRLAMQSEPGLARALPPGMTFKPWETNHPNANFAGFQKAMLRTVARGINPMGMTSYAGFSGDLESVNYSSIRAGILPERDAYRVLQRWLTQRLHRVIYPDVIRQAVLTGQVVVPSFATSGLLAHRYRYRGWQWVDPMKEIMAAKEEIGIGVNSRQNIAAERGRDYGDVVEQLAEEEQIAGEAGVDVSGVPQPAITSAPPPPGYVPDEDDDELPGARRTLTRIA